MIYGGNIPSIQQMSSLDRLSSSRKIDGLSFSLLDFYAPSKWGWVTVSRQHNRPCNMSHRDTCHRQRWLGEPLGFGGNFIFGARTNLVTILQYLPGYGHFAFNRNSECSVGQEWANELDEGSRKMRFGKFIQQATFPTSIKTFCRWTRKLQP